MHHGDDDLPVVARPAQRVGLAKPLQLAIGHGSPDPAHADECRCLIENVDVRLGNLAARVAALGEIAHHRRQKCFSLALARDPSLLANPVNFLRITYHPCGARRWIVNWDELSRHLLGRAERELGVTTNDPTGAALLDEMRGHMGTPAYERFPSRQDAADLLVPIHVRKDDLELRLFCTYMTLGTPQDVTLQELRIETFFPADEASERTWHERFASFVSPAFSQPST